MTELFWPPGWLCSQLLSTVRAVDVLSVDDKALVGQGEGAFLAVEAVLVPGVTLVVHHVGPMAKPCDGILAAIALLGHGGLVAVHTVDLLLVGGEAGSGQALTACMTHKALGVPGLVLVAYTTCGDGLLAVEAFLGKFLLMARAAEYVVALVQEALRADWLLALEAGEALLMPHLVLILHVLGAWHDHLVAGLAPVAILAGATRATHDLAVVPGTEGLVSQGLVALGTAEAVLVPVTVLMVQLLGISPNGATAFGACVGTELVEALCTHVLLILHHILLPMQVVTAIVTVKAFRHGGSRVAPRPYLQA